MSRIGKLPVPVPKGVKVDYKGDLISAKGPKGALELKVPQGVDIQITESEINVLRRDDTKDSRRILGLARSLINNLIIGVSKGYEKTLNIVGVGYKANLRGKVLNLALGYSHPIDYPIPEGIDISVEDRQTTVKVAGADKQLVGAVASKIRSFKPPEPYKGKGIKYADEYIRRKVGKAGK